MFYSIGVYESGRWAGRGWRGGPVMDGLVYFEIPFPVSISTNWDGTWLDTYVNYFSPVVTEDDIPLFEPLE